VGAVVTDESIELATVMNGFIIPKAAVSRPELVALGVEWPHEIGLSTSEARQIGYKGAAYPLIDVDLVVRTFTRDDPIEFDVVSDDWSLRYVFTFGEDGPAVVAVGGDATVTGAGSSWVVTRRLSRSASFFIADSAALTPVTRSVSTFFTSRRPDCASLRASTNSASTSPLARSDASRTTRAIRRNSSTSASGSSRVTSTSVRMTASGVRS
jgi:hypothetical protein